MMQKDISEYISESLALFGKETDTNRQLAYVLDGLKPVYRRTINSSLKFKNKVKTATIVGDVIGTTHPHGDSSVSETVSRLVRWGIFDGQGNHGAKMIYGDDISASHMRYTEATLNSNWRSIFDTLMPYVPYKEAEIPGNVEPEYLPTPIPMILLFNGSGIGYGINCRYPMFTAESILDAYANNDPTRLKAPFGLELDPTDPGLWDLWNTGLGTVTYSFKVEQTELPSGHGTMISGSPEMFKPLLEKAFFEELNKGQVYFIDQTAGDIPQVFVGRSYNVRAISLDEIYEVCKQICTTKKVFRLSVTDGETAFVIPLKDWLDVCFKNYLKLVQNFKDDKLAKLNFEKSVYTWLPVITESLINNRDWDAEELAEHNNCDLDIVKAILRKSINTLRRMDSESKIIDIDKEIKDYTNLDPIKHTRELISRMK